MIGKGILRFHAVYWPAILLSAGEPLPTTHLRPRLPDGRRRQALEVARQRADPGELVDRYGPDALRWWLAREVPREGDADFREELLAARANELADDLGNLVNRTVSLVGRFRPDGVELGAGAGPLQEVVEGVSGAIDAALARFDFRTAADALWHVVAEGNRLVARTKPWELAKREESAGELDTVLSALVAACRTVAVELRPFLPEAAERIERVLESGDPALGRTLFPKSPARLG